MSGVRIFSGALNISEYSEMFFVYREFKANLFALFYRKGVYMTKKEFLKGLEEALLENMDISQAAPHIRYYKEYIESETEKGRDEEEVVASLQSPRLIAKNIINNSESAGRYDNNIHDDYSDGSINVDRTERKGYSFSINGKPVDSVWVKLAAIILGLLVIALVLTIVSGILWIVFRFVLPIAVIAFAIIFIAKSISNSSK